MYSANLLIQRSAFKAQMYWWQGANNHIRATNCSCADTHVKYVGQNLYFLIAFYVHKNINEDILLTCLDVTV